MCVCGNAVAITCVISKLQFNVTAGNPVPKLAVLNGFRF